MADEVIYKFVRGQGWVPRTEIDDLDDDLKWAVEEALRSAPRVSWTNEPIRLLQREFIAATQRAYPPVEVDERFVDCGVPNCEFCQAYRRER